MSSLSIWYNRFRGYLSGKHPGFYNRCNRHKSVIKFIFSGTTAAATDLVFLYIFHGLFRWELILAASLAFIISFFVSFSLQKFWTFRNRRPNKTLSQLSLYFINALVGLGFNAILMHLFAAVLGIWYILAQFVVNIIIGFWNFTVYKYIIFKHR